MLAAALLRRSRRSLVGSAGGGVRSFAVAPTIVKKWCLFYDYVDGVEEKRAPHRADHISLVGDYVGRGEISSGGAFAGPVDGALIIFASREAAEAFAAEDPYVANGIVTASKIREWSTVSFDA